jgi:putative Mn2+ efflux pump MntP
MLWLLALLVASVSNLDNLGVGVAFGIRDMRVAIAPNSVIAALTMAGTAGAMRFGHELSELVSPSMATTLGR